MITRSFDLAVVGGGPGGSAAALEAARQGLTVVLYEPRREGHPKPCGEGMMPAGREALERLGLARVLEHGRPFDHIRYRAPGLEPLDVPIGAPGLAIPRAELQAALDEAVARTVAITRVSAAARAERAGVAFGVRAGGYQALARALVVADGLGGRAASWLREPRRRARGRRVGVRAYFEERDGLERVEVHLGGAVEVYLTPLPGGLVNAAFLFPEPPPGHGADRWVARVLAERPAARAALGPQVGRAESRDLARPRPRRVAGGAAYLVGDAGGGVDPIVGCGLTVALRTGIAAAQAASAVVHGADERAMARAYARRYRAETRARRLLAAGLRRVSDRPALARVAVRAASSVPALARHLAGVAARGGPLSVGGAAG